jgi:ATP-binding cassette subfamily F protein uup
LYKAFGTRPVLDDASMTIRTGERVGIVGSNGSGKSTLARILAGAEPVDSGTVARRRGAEIAYLPQEPRFEGSPTVHEVVQGGLAAWSDAKARHEKATAELERGGLGPDVLAGLLEKQTEAASDVERFGGWDRMHQIEALLGHLGVRDASARVTELSGGEQRRVALARVLIARPQLAILDEPTNHLDVESVAWLERYLIEEHPGALLLITHDRYLLDRVVERTLELDQGKLYAYDGGYELYLEQKAERLAHEARTESNRQNFLRRELEWLSRQPKARGTKQQARIRRIEDARAAPAPKQERTVSLSMGDTRTGKTILELRGVALDRGGRRLFQGFDWVLTKGERIGIVGRNGTGKTTLLRAILGELAPAEGTLVVGQNTRIAYFDQTRQNLEEERSVFENVIGDHPYIEVAGEPVTPHGYLERFLFDGSKQRQPVGSLSGGERARVILAKLLAEPANLVLLDEPTNDLDLSTLGALEQMLVEFGGTSMVVTHDRWFLDRVATSILAFEGDGRVVRYPGNYSTYCRLREEARERAPEPALERGAKAPARPRKSPREDGPRSLTMQEKKELEGIVDRIDEAERRTADLERRLEDPALYAGGGTEVRAVIDELEKARAEAVRLTARWEELEARRG